MPDGGGRSAQAEVPQDEQDDHDGADEPDDSVHDSFLSLNRGSGKPIWFERLLS
jgi:hypothetical protein